MVGDLKVVRKPNERMNGDLSWYDDDEMMDFCMRDVKLEDLRFSCAFLTWQDKQENTSSEGFERGIVNMKWLVEFSFFDAWFLPPGLSNHTPCLVNKLDGQERRHLPFKFLEFWIERPSFHTLVQDSGSESFSG